MTPIAFIDLKAQYRALKSEVAQRIETVLDHGSYINGPEIAELEGKLTALTGARATVAVSSGTDALVIPLMAWGIGPGDAVFVPAFTYNATANAVLLAGATPVFVDVDERTFTIDVEHLGHEVRRVHREANLKPRAVIPVDLFGVPANYPAIEAIAADFGLMIMADAAQSLGGSRQGRSVGSLAAVTATSFFPSKTLGAYGDGGAVFVMDEGLVPVLESIRWHGTDANRKESLRVGMNGRLDSLQAAILLAKLTVFEREIARRQEIVRRYDEALGDHVTSQVVPPGTATAGSLYCVLANDRDRVQERLKARGVPTAIYYARPLHLHAAFQSYGRGEGSLPVCEALSRRILALPLHPYLSNEAVDVVIDAVRASA